jgi:hypothetical protein
MRRFHLPNAIYELHPNWMFRGRMQQLFGARNIELDDNRVGFDIVAGRDKKKRKKKEKISID